MAVVVASLIWLATTHTWYSPWWSRNTAPTLLKGINHMGGYQIGPREEGCKFHTSKLMLIRYRIVFNIFQNHRQYPNLSIQTSTSTVGTYGRHRYLPIYQSPNAQFRAPYGAYRSTSHRIYQLLGRYWSYKQMFDSIILLRNQLNRYGRYFKHVPCQSRSFSLWWNNLLI